MAVDGCVELTATVWPGITFATDEVFTVDAVVLLTPCIPPVLIGVEFILAILTCYGGELAWPPVNLV